jgi:hypothetical protein
MKKVFLSAVCMIFAISLLCGCDSKPKEKAAKIIEPAMLITKDDAKAIAGAAFGECTVKEQPAVGLKLCVYEKDGAFLQVGLTQAAFMDKKNGNTPESIYNSIKGAFKDAPKIDGVGDDNFIAPPLLHIMKGGYYLTVSMGASSDTAKLKTAGQKAVENIGKLTAK